MTELANNKGARGDNIVRLVFWGGAGALLLTPLVAMRFTDEVNWTGSDFAIMAVMMAIPLTILEVTMRMSRSMMFRGAVLVALGAAFFMTWVNLAVGIIGDENNPLNQLFFIVLGVGALGALIASFRPRGLALALVAMAVAQAAVAVVAVLNGHNILPLSGFFVLAWLLSAWLFRKSAQEREATA